MTTYASAGQPATERSARSGRRGAWQGAAIGAVAALLWATGALGAISGTVFRDYNGDGKRDAAEPGVPGIAVSAYDGKGARAAGAATGADGSYSLTTGPGNYRVEIAGIPSYLRPGPVGANSASTVLFVADGAAGVDGALVSPAEFSRGVPSVVTAIHINGNPIAGGVSGQQNALVKFPYDSSGPPSAKIVPLAKQLQVGALGGLAVQRSTATVFGAALAKRHTGFGPGGPGAIYAAKMDSPDLAGDLLFLDLNALLGSNVTGSIARTGADALPPGAKMANHDPNGWDAVGKVGFGDIDLSEDERTLWALSLGDRVLYSIFIDNPARRPARSDVVAHPIQNPGCSDGEFRPWAIKVHDGKVYVGIVCSAETSQNLADLIAGVLAFDPASGTWSDVFHFPLNYPRAYVSSGGNIAAEWRPWASTMKSLARNGKLGFGNQLIYPQPILSDIEFDETGAMILGFLDRNGHQTGEDNLNATPGTPTFFDLANGSWKPAGKLGFKDNTTYDGASAGDLLRACRSGDGYALESNGACAGVQTKGSGNGQGPGGGEFYWQDLFQVPAGSHAEIAIGSLALIPGSGEVMTTVFDPLSEAHSGGVVTFYSGGSNAGTRSRAFQVFKKLAPGTFGKAAGLSDIELLLPEAPIEIGNRVWNDANGNGIQDPGEPGIANVPVGLYSGGKLVATATTDANGNYLFSSDGAKTGTASAQYKLALTPGGSYQLRIGLKEKALTDLAPTKKDAVSPGSDGDLRDSDGDNGALNPGYSTIGVVLGRAGENNHSYDMGFAPLLY